MRRRIPLVVATVVAVAVLLGQASPFRIDGDHPTAGPSWAHWLGTDAVGRDVLARLALGTLISAGVSIAATSLVLFEGLLLGGLAGASRPRLERWGATLIDLALALPRVPLMLVAAAWPSLQGWGPVGSLVRLLLVLALLGWASWARMVRDLCRELGRGPAVRTAQAWGASWLWCWRAHYLRSLRPLVRVQARSLFARMLYLETLVSFLGLGVTPPWPSLGNLAAAGMETFAENPAAVAAPVLVAALLALMANWRADPSSRPV